MKSAVLFLVSAAFLFAQEADRVTVPFSDPSAPKRVQLGLINGGITVKAYNGKEAIIEATTRGGERRRRQPPPGMRRIENPGAGLSVEESNNLLRLGVSAMENVSNVTLTLPVDTSVKLSTINSGNIVVEGLSGEVEVSNTNGDVTITDISGAVTAHALNGKLIVTLNQVPSGKAMSFSTLNGNIDVTLPADTKANLKMKSENGDIFSDFDIQLQARGQPAVQSNEKGKYKVKFDRSLTGTINGGGPEMQFTTLNGTIYIRKK